ELPALGAIVERKALSLELIVKIIAEVVRHAFGEGVGAVATNEHEDALRDGSTDDIERYAGEVIEILLENTVVNSIGEKLRNKQLETHTNKEGRVHEYQLPLVWRKVLKYADQDLH